MKEENQVLKTTLVIFGATGDLTKRKLLTALYHLHSRGHLDQIFTIVGVARSQLTDENFRSSITESLIAGGIDDPARSFLDLFTYQSADVTKPESYQVLADRLIELEKPLQTCTNKLFYLAMSPTFYETVFNNLAHSGLTLPCGPTTNWTRILVEKPFGKDVATAKKLDDLLGLLFKEDQIFRIDHYLGRETLQDLLMFRFSNSLFSPIWNAKHIESVHIKLHETLDMQGRGEFYDGIGALRDVGQNHVLQMLALVTMDRPQNITSEAIRNRRSSLLSQVRLYSDNLEKDVYRAQYEGYTQESGVHEDSSTETYFRIRARIDSERWANVPILLEHGKALNEKCTEIVITFKPNNECLCSSTDHSTHKNVLTFRIQPNEGISIDFYAKKDGFDLDLEKKVLSFHYRDERRDHVRDPYEYILNESLRGEQTLFTSTDELQASWKFITGITDRWNTLPLQKYEKGSTGPIIEDNLN